jgi:hypothetical protein
MTGTSFNRWSRRWHTQRRPFRRRSAIERIFLPGRLDDLAGLGSQFQFAASIQVDKSHRASPLFGAPFQTHVAFGIQIQVEDSSPLSPFLIDPTDCSLHAALDQSVLDQDHAFQKENSLVALLPG